MKKYLNIVGFVFILDQVTKFLCFNYLILSETLSVMPFFNLQLAYNEGAAFGFLSDQPGWQRLFLISINLTISIVILIWLKQIKYQPSKKWEGLSLSLILGGALGNVFDRIYHGYVIDFIDFYVSDWHWYNFNVADIAICVGAFLFFIVSFKKE